MKPWRMRRPVGPQRADVTITNAAKRPAGGTGRPALYADTEAAVHVSGLGFGTAPVGNLYAAVADDGAERALRRTRQLGIRYFDSAPFHGHGLAETRLDRALAGR